MSDELDMSSLEEGERKAQRVRDPFRFALTGVQPKLSLSRDHEQLTVPMEGQDGGWIAKFGSPAFRSLVENECAMLEWARVCGLDVPDHRVIRASEIENLPEDFDPDQSVLVVRRFDRGDSGARVHQEDFAQVFDIPPEEKYPWEVADLGWLHYGSIGAVIHALCGAEDYREYMRRLVFMVLSGNADAHIKNWALVYPDGLRAQLSPVYDFVSTVVYPSLWSHSALRWSAPKRPTIEPEKALADVTIDDLLLAASYSSADTSVIMDDISEFADTMRATWPTVSGSAPDVVREAVAAHLQSAKLR